MLPGAGVAIKSIASCFVTIFVNGYQGEVEIKSGSWLMLM